jgi:hypothetical protein
LLKKYIKNKNFEIKLINDKKYPIFLIALFISKIKCLHFIVFKFKVVYTYEIFSEYVLLKLEKVKFIVQYSYLYNPYHHIVY